MVVKKKVAVQKTAAKPKARKHASPKPPTPKSVRDIDVPNKKAVQKPKAKPKAKAVKPEVIKPPKAPRQRGAPTTYTDKIAIEVLVNVALGFSMRRIAAMKNMPAMSTIFKWLRDHEDFAEQYTRAKEEAAELFVEDMIDIADDATNDYMEKYGKDGDMIGYMINGEFVQRSRLRIETRKWIAVKLKPKKYGDKLAVDTTGEVNHTHAYSEKSDDELNAIVRAHMAELEKKK